MPESMLSHPVTCLHGKDFVVSTEVRYCTPYHDHPWYETAVRPRTPEGDVLDYLPIWDATDSEKEAEMLHFETVGRLAVGGSLPTPVAPADREELRKELWGVIVPTCE
ncbi:MAG: hypothetical protein A2Y57_03035 [Candidatus Woykebacteria bacterium RBG_13_40_7b]|uniref:Uncharacterized protein n=1 Tax=Candidatus Woykebacteria bacterium RBG_13_40_7b TaxID=1802594 RepID=A0A1G1W7P6_9BACT|nr:MAG: hypothetical protein A2Y57_03035 [Candidatus Woykebacteria bacterium RBG_13_40_7b]